MITAAQFSAALRGGLIDSWAILGYNATQPIHQKFIPPLRAKLPSNFIVLQEFGGIGLLATKGENAGTMEVTPEVGFTKNKEYDELALKLTFSKRFIEDESLGLMAEYVQRLVAAGPRTQEFRAAQVFNAGDAVTYHTTPDGLALFANAHRLVPRGAANYDTLATEATPSAASVQAGLTQIDQRVDEFGLPVDEDVEGILFGAGPLEWKFAELLQSVQSPEDNRGAINPIPRLRNIKAYKWKYLTNPLAWYFICKSNQHGIRYVRRIPLQMQRSGDFNTDAVLVRVRGRDTFVTAHPRGVLGNIP